MVLTSFVDVRAGHDQAAGQRGLDVEVLLMGERVTQIRRHGEDAAPGGLRRLQGLKFARGVRKAAASTASYQCLSNSVRRAAGSIVQDVGEKAVVENSVARTEHRLISSEEASQYLRRVGDAHTRRQVILIRYLLRPEGIRESSAGESWAQARVNGRELQSISRGAPKFVTQSQIKGKVLLDA